MSTEKVGIRELRQHASRYIERVKHGERVEITERGVLVAVLAPPSEEDLITERLIQDGAFIPATASLLDITPQPSTADELPSVVLERLREAETR